MYNSQAKQNTSKNLIILKSLQSYFSRIGLDYFGFVDYGFVGYGLNPLTHLPPSSWWGRSSLLPFVDRWLDFFAKEKPCTYVQGLIKPI